MAPILSVAGFSLILVFGRNDYGVFMYQFLLAEKHFKSLKDYVGFLRALPATLLQIQRFSERWQRQGHVLTSAPDAERLKVLASFSTGYLENLENNISDLGKACNESLSYISTFTEECREIARETPGKGRSLPISDIDFKRFSLSASQWWIWFPPTDVKGLTHELYFRLGRTTSAVLDLKSVPRELNLDIHNVFARFVRSLTLQACQCHTQYSRIEAYYIVGGVTLPGMKASSGASDAVARSKVHVRELFALYTAASSAINNLNDFFYAIRAFLASAERELLAVKPSMKLSQLISSLAVTGHILSEVKMMTEQMQRWSRQ